MGLGLGLPWWEGAHPGRARKSQRTGAMISQYQRGTAVWKQQQASYWQGASLEQPLPNKWTLWGAWQECLGTQHRNALERGAQGLNGHAVLRFLNAFLVIQRGFSSPQISHGHCFFSFCFFLLSLWVPLLIQITNKGEREMKFSEIIGIFCSLEQRRSVDP